MLGKPHYGWTLFQLEENAPKYDLSNLTNVCFEWLNQAIHGLETLEPFSVHGVCEPGRMICTISYWNCYVIFEGEDREDSCSEEVYCSHMSMIDFCKQLYKDIEVNIDEWKRWNESLVRDDLEDEFDDEALEVELNKIKMSIRERLDVLSGLIRKNEEHFGPNRFFM